MIQMRQVCFHYHNGTQGVADIDLQIRKGECVVLTGVSGSGKTTITRLLNALAPAHYPGTRSGRIELEGRDITALPLWEMGKWVGSVFQDPKSQFFSSQLPGEVAFGCENYGFPHAEIVYRTEKAIHTFTLEGLRTHPLDMLSSGEKQRTAIASVYALHPDIYVCDEPTANLDEAGSEQLRQIMAQLKTEGKTIVITEHRLAWLYGIADRYCYVHQGRIVWEKNGAEMATLSDDERKYYSLRSIKKNTMPALPSPKGSGQPFFQVSNLSLYKKQTAIFENVHMSLWKGNITALIGNNGIGKTSLALVLSGLNRETQGKIAINGKEVSPVKRRQKIWYGANDTGTQFFTHSVTEELLVGAKRSATFLDQCRNILKRLGLYEYKDSHPAILSGGEKQRLSIACGILSNRDILIFDEPTSGLDGRNMTLIATILREAADRGKSVLVITHDNELIQACCDYCLKMEDIKKKYR